MVTERSEATLREGPKRRFIRVRMGDGRFPRNTQGFTLIDILVAMLIFSIVMVGLATMQVLAIRTTTYTRLLTVATVIAESQIEEYRVRPYASLSAGSIADDCFDYDGRAVSDCQTGTFYTRSGLLTATDNGFIVTTTVSWATQQGDRSISMNVERLP